MNLSGKTIGFALTGSFCTLKTALRQMQRFVEAGSQVIPIVSENVFTLNTRFFTRVELLTRISEITPHPLIHTIPDAEPIGPHKLLDLLAVAPCTGNSLAKLVHGITDTPVLMAAKAQLRTGRPVVLAICTNDGLSQNAENIGRACSIKNIYLTPMCQDDPTYKPSSVVARMDMLLPACRAALDGRQLQPILTVKEAAV